MIFTILILLIADVIIGVSSLLYRHRIDEKMVDVMLENSKIQKDSAEQIFYVTNKIYNSEEDDEWTS